MLHHTSADFPSRLHGTLGSASFSCGAETGCCVVGFEGGSVGGAPDKVMGRGRRLTQLRVGVGRGAQAPGHFALWFLEDLGPVLSLLSVGHWTTHQEHNTRGRRGHFFLSTGMGYKGCHFLSTSPRPKPDVIEPFQQIRKVSIEKPISQLSKLRLGEGKLCA